MTVAGNLYAIQNIIAEHCDKVGRPVDDINIIAVTKYVSVQKALEAVNAGVHHIGENRKEGLLQKKHELKDNKIQWHFIGSLQSRKVKDVVNEIDYLHSLDRISLAEEIQKRRTKSTLKCFIQLNLSGESSKHGIKAEELISFIEELKPYDKIMIAGLMTMAPHTDDTGTIRQVFRKLKDCQTAIQKRAYPHAPCDFLSMGMSNDYTIAIEEGAHFIRIGTALVGKDD